MNNKFSYGDAVIIKQNAPSSFRPGEYRSICSVDQATSDLDAQKFKCQTGDWFYTVEFQDGSDTQILEHYLDKDLGIIQGRELSGYASEFINGSISFITVGLGLIQIKIRSLPVHKKISEPLLVSKDNCLSGNLIVLQLENMSISNHNYLSKTGDSGNILEFILADNHLKLLVEWEWKRTTLVEVKAGQFWWEQRELFDLRRVCD